MKTKIRRILGGWASVVMIITVAFFVVVSPRASAGTPVGGYIDTDTHWTLRDSPYWVENDVIIRNGANLTIEIGVDVLFNGYYSIFVEDGGVLWMGRDTTERFYALFSSNLTTKSIGDWRSIQFNGSSYDSSSIIQSVIEYATYGIRLESASPTIQNSTIRNCTYGIYSNYGCPTIENNTIENCVEDGIHISGNDPVGGHTTIKTSTVYNNTNRGIVFYDVSSALLRNNSITGSSYNFGVWGVTPSEFDHDIDDSNTVEQKPIYYWRNHEHDDETVPSDAGYVGIVNSTNIAVENLTLTHNGQGVLVAYSNYTGIDNVTAADNELGTILFSSPNNTIENCNISSNDYNGYFLCGSGVHISNSDDNYISNNTVDYNKYGICLVSGSNYDIITNNTLTGNEEIGILLSADNNNVNNVNNNTVSYSDCGVFVHSDYNLISFNGVTDCDYGIFLGHYYADVNTVNNNNVSYNNYGIYISGSMGNTICNNIVYSNTYNGVHITYFIYVPSWTSKYNTISNNTATDNGDYGIYMQGYSMSLDYNEISNNTVSLNDNAGIVMSQTLYNNITYNDIFSNNDYGIMMGASANHNNIHNNNISSNEKGIYLAQAGLNSIKFNAIHDNDYGIYLYKTEDNNISHNNISSNDFDGIYFTSEAKPDDIYDNIITWNGDAGINCTSSSDPTIKSNDIENNTRNGVWSEGGSDPVINYNNICNNGGGASGDGYGVINKDNGIEIDAQHNWWNAASGPYHPIGNPGGTGDQVSSYVDFDPYSNTRL